MRKSAVRDAKAGPGVVPGAVPQKKFNTLTKDIVILVDEAVKELGADRLTKMAHAHLMRATIETKTKPNLGYHWEGYHTAFESIGLTLRTMDPPGWVVTVDVNITTEKAKELGR